MKPNLATHGVQIVARFDDSMVLDLHLSKLKLMHSAEILFIGINPSMRAPEPFCVHSPSGELLWKFLPEVEVPYMIWNFCPSLSFLRNGNDVSYDEILMEYCGMLDTVHALNYELLAGIVASSKNLKHIWALGRRPLEWLQSCSCSWFQRYSLLGTRHPAFFIRQQPLDTHGFLKCMRMALASIGQLQAQCVDPEPDTHLGLWFEPLVVEFLTNHWQSVSFKAICKMLALHPTLQGVVVAQGSVNSPIAVQRQLDIGSRDFSSFQLPYQQVWFAVCH